MKKTTKKIIQIILVIVVVLGFWHVLKPLPKGIYTKGQTHHAASEDIVFLSDLTYIDSQQNRQSEQQIFDTIFTMIDEAKSYILIDMFLFNDFLGSEKKAYRGLAGELTQKLVEKKKLFPEIQIIFISDPINSVYGGDISQQYKELEKAGVTVIVTDLKKLRDSNPLYSAPWRMLGQWWGNTSDGGRLPHLMDDRRPKLTLRTYLGLLNFKANHRKVIVTDAADDFVTLITSANPHDGSSAHTNVALKIHGKIAADVIATEKAVADFSAGTMALPEVSESTSEERRADAELNLLTEGAIKDVLIKDIEETTEGDTIDMMMFYIADRGVIKALEDAAKRNVTLRFIFDPNKDAFGRKKNGIPNRQVASELMTLKEERPQTPIDVRWCNTHGEQCHSKMTIINQGQKKIIHLGSANLTRRNIGNFNLETNIRVSAQQEIDAFKRAQTFFNLQWTNENEIIYTKPYEAFRDDSAWRYFLYRFMEATGMSSF